MTRTEAVQAMKRGGKVNHRFFARGELLYMKDGDIHTECHFNLGTISDEFWTYRGTTNWLTGWSEIELILY